jgi:hypothetical protein
VICAGFGLRTARWLLAECRPGLVAWLLAGHSREIHGVLAWDVCGCSCLRTARLLRTEHHRRLVAGLFAGNSRGIRGGIRAMSAGWLMGCRASCRAFAVTLQKTHQQKTQSTSVPEVLRAADAHDETPGHTTCSCTRRCDLVRAVYARERNSIWNGRATPRQRTATGRAHARAQRLCAGFRRHAAALDTVQSSP